MAHERVKFAAEHNHTFPNGSMIRYRAGWEGPVLQAVADSARERNLLADTLPRNIMQLRKLARDEEIDLGDAMTVADIQALITAARAARAIADDTLRDEHLSQ